MDELCAVENLIYRPGVFSNEYQRVERVAIGSKGMILSN